MSHGMGVDERVTGLRSMWGRWTCWEPLDDGRVCGDQADYVTTEGRTVCAAHRT